MSQTCVCICIKYLSFFLCPKLIMPQIQFMNNRMNAFLSHVSSLHLVSVPILMKNIPIISFEDIICFEPLKVKTESEVTQSCLTLCGPMDRSPPGSSVHGVFQARILEWVAISFSSGSSWSRNQTQVSHIVGRRFTVWATRELPFRFAYLIVTTANVKSLTPKLCYTGKMLKLLIMMQALFHLLSQTTALSSSPSRFFHTVPPSHV